MTRVATTRSPLRFLPMILILIMIFGTGAANSQDQEHEHDHEQEVAINGVGKSRRLVNLPT